jgi:Uma2 family endonuclease
MRNIRIVSEQPPVYGRRLPRRARRTVPLLVKGAALDADEFMRRYEAMPEECKAELIDGVVYIMASPVSYDDHGTPSMKMHTWLGIYELHTKGVEACSESTARLGPKNVPQPDMLLRILPEYGGSSFVQGHYLYGAPELVVEVSASTSLIDSGRKREAYRRAGVKEYINWLTEAGVINWWHLKDNKYELLQPDEDGIVRSRVFPGLWLDVQAALSGNKAGVMRVLRRGLKSPEHRAFLKK